MKRSAFYLWSLTLIFLCSGKSFVVVAQKISDAYPVIKSTNFKNVNFNIKNYGAKADGVTLNTKSIQSAIDECNAKGGGSVVVPVGMWLTGPAHTKNPM